MNMARTKFDNFKPDRGQFGPQTVLGRLREYAKVRHEPPVNPFPPENTLYRIMKERTNAGARGSGAKYEIIYTDDEAEGVAVRPDGGLGALAERSGGRIARKHRCQEIATALHKMPVAYKEIVEAMYHVDQWSKPRTYEKAAMRLGMAKTTYQSVLDRAYGWLEGHLDLPIDRTPICSVSDER